MFHKGQSLYILLYGFIPSLPLPGLNQFMAATNGSLDQGVIRKMNNNTVNAVVNEIVQTSDVRYRTVSIINTQHIWLGKLYFNLTKELICLYSENCIKVSTIEWDRVSGIIKTRNVRPATQCIQQLPWSYFQTCIYWWVKYATLPMKIYSNLIENANRVIINASSAANHRRFVVNIRYANIGKLKYFENDLEHK